MFMEKKAGADDRRAVLDLADLLEQVCMLNPDNRPAIADCLKHRFVAGREDPKKKAEAAAAAAKDASPPPPPAAPGSKSPARI